MTLVIDASVALKWVIEESGSVAARRLLSEEALIAPDLLFIECANVFWKWVQRSAYSDKDARAHLRDLTSLGLIVIPVQIIAGEVLDIALKHRITAYDACYVAVSKQTRFPLITASACAAASGSGGRASSRLARRTGSR